MNPFNRLSGKLIPLALRLRPRSLPKDANQSEREKNSCGKAGQRHGAPAIFERQKNSEDDRDHQADAHKNDEALQKE